MRLIAAEIAVKELALRVREVHNHQAIQSVGKFRVDVESQKFSAEPDVLPQENGHSGAARLEVGHEFGEFVNVTAECSGTRARRSVAGAH